MDSRLHGNVSVPKESYSGDGRLAKIVANATTKESKTVIVVFILLVLLSYLKNIHNTIFHALDLIYSHACRSLARPSLLLLSSYSIHDCIL